MKWATLATAALGSFLAASNPAAAETLKGCKWEGTDLPQQLQNIGVTSVLTITDGFSRGLEYVGPGVLLATFSDNSQVEVVLTSTAGIITIPGQKAPDTSKGMATFDPGLATTHKFTVDWLAQRAAVAAACKPKQP